MLRRHQVDANTIFAGQASDGLRAALAEMRLLARKHLTNAQGKLASSPPEILPALLPAALVGPTLRQMERPDYQPLRFEPAAAWRRQWWLWRAARNPVRIFRG